MVNSEQGDQPTVSLAEIAREYQRAQAAAVAAREVVKPATAAAREAKALFVSALKAAGLSAVVVDGQLYRIAENGQFVEGDVQVLE